MSRRRLQLVAIAAPVSMVAVFALLMQSMVVTTEQHVVAGTIMVLGTLAFALAAYAVIAGSQRTILAQNRELAALNAVSAMASRSRDTASGLRLALGKVLEASRADAVEVLLWDERLQQLTPWVRRAELPAWSTDLARLAEQPLAAAQEAQGYSPAIYVADIQEDGRLATSAGETVFRSFASVPLRVKERTLGVMNLAARRPGVLGPAAESLLSNVAKQISLAAENSRLFQELQQREKEARILYQIATEVLSNLDTDRIADLIVSHARTLFGADVVTLCLVEERTRDLVAARRVGPEHVFRADPPRVQFRATEAGGEASAASLALLRAEELHWHLATSLRVGNEVLGEICVGGTKPRHVSEREHELLASLASQAAIALSNARLYAAAQDVAILEERDRIAREMHDSLAQVLGYLALMARTIRGRLTAEEIPDRQRDLDEMAAVADEAYIDVREAILGLRESIAHEAGLTGALGQYLQKFTRQSGITAKLLVKEGTRTRFSSGREVQLVRIIQEALTNVRKHSGAHRAWVRFEGVNGSVRISIQDDGRGFDAARLSNPADHGFGLQTMAERAERVGGTLEIDSTPGKGTRVTVCLPAEREEAVNGAH